MDVGSRDLKNRAAYLFLDEGGDFNFSPTGTRYLKYVLERMAFRDIKEVIVITDQLPLGKKKKAFKKAIKHTLKEMLPTKIKYQLLHHSSKSASGLQIADYFNWAIFRAWERGDRRSIKLVEEAINSQFDIFKPGDTYYYEYAVKK